MIVTEQSHVLAILMSHVLYSDLKGHFWVLCSIYLTSCCLCLATVVLMLFLAIGSGFVWLILVCLATVFLVFT